MDIIKIIDISNFPLNDKGAVIVPCQSTDGSYFVNVLFKDLLIANGYKKSDLLVESVDRNEIFKEKMLDKDGLEITKGSEVKIKIGDDGLFDLKTIQLIK